MIVQSNDELLVSYGEQYFKKTRRVRLGLPAEHKEDMEEEDCSDTEAPTTTGRITDHANNEDDQSTNKPPPVLLLKESSV